MPRNPRPDLAGIPQHIVQRGNNRQACFFAETDYTCYLTQLRGSSVRYGCRIHAYVLMTNHVHLLATPEEVGAVSRMMQLLGRQYVGHVNGRYRRSGTLWEGRFKSSLVDTQRYLLACYRYIELNPLRAAMVASPADYRWSSYHANALGGDDPLVTPHPEYLDLGKSREARRKAYRGLFDEVLDEETINEIRRYLDQQKALGSNRFRQAIEQALGRCMTWRPAHRPPASSD